MNKSLRLSKASPSPERIKDVALVLQDLLTGDEQVTLWNGYCDKIGAHGLMLRPMSDLDEELDAMTPTEIIREIQEHEHFSIFHAYFYTNDNVLSSVMLPSELIDFEALAKYVLTTPEVLRWSFRATGKTFGEVIGEPKA